MRTIAFIFVSSVLLAQQKDIVIQTRGPQALGTVAFIGGEMVGGPTVTGQPYSADAVTESTQTLADGNRIVNKSTAKIYRDSAGRERREQPLPKIGNLPADNNSPTAVMISDPVAKMNYTLDASAKRAMKMPHPSLPAVSTTGEVRSGVFTQAMPLPGGIRVTGSQVMLYSGMTSAAEGPSPKVEDLGKRIIEGVQAEGTRTTMTIPAGQAGNDRAIEIVNERWFSPELQVVVMSKHSDPRMGETVYQLSNVSRAEPLPSLFEIPSDYQVSDLLPKLQTIEQHSLKNDE